MEPCTLIESPEALDADPIGAELATAADDVEPGAWENGTPAPLESFLQGAASKTKIKLPGGNRLLSEFAADLGRAISHANLFRRAGAAVRLNESGDGFEFVSPDYMRTWIERHAVCYRMIQADERKIEICVTMSGSEARGVLESGQFLEQLRPVSAIFPIARPIMRTSGKIELTRPGYDDESQSFTGGALEIPAMAFATAKAYLDNLLCDCCFANDGGRSLAVTVGAMLTVWGRGLMPRQSLRPAFIFIGNCEGSGKTLLAKLCTVPALGYFPSAPSLADDSEWRKHLFAIAAEGRPATVFDNIKGTIGCPSLEQFLTSQNISGRVLGVSKTICVENDCTIFLTGNQAGLTPDMRRRSLICELFMPLERAEDRVFKRRLDLPEILNERVNIIAALWALVRNWDAKGRPSCARPHSAFPAWADVIGGIVQAAGYSCPTEPAEIDGAGDTDLEDMRALVASATKHNAKVTLDMPQLSALISEIGAFDRLMKHGELNNRLLGYVLKAFNGRLVGNCRFAVAGKGHQRRFIVTKLAEEAQVAQVAQVFTQASFPRD